MRRLHVICGAIVMLCLAAPAFAQTGRVGGVVKDTDGKPIKGATVKAQNPSASPSEFTATTDDRGEFRVYGLMPGEYVINGSVRAPTNIVVVNGLPAAPNAMPSDGYPPTFYPGTANANDAQ